MRASITLEHVAGDFRLLRIIISAIKIRNDEGVAFIEAGLLIKRGFADFRRDQTLLESGRRRTNRLLR